MKSWLLSRPILPSEIDPGSVAGAVYTETYLSGAEAREVWDVLSETDPTPEDSFLIGSWDADSGFLASSLHEDFYIIRPLGNYRDGRATRPLLYHHWDTRGLKNRRLDDQGNFYPADNEPFRIEVRHKFFDEYPDPNHNGWGWVAEIRGSVQTRDPGVHAIGIYDDAECTEYLYTTGAFIRGISEWQYDEDGALIEVWRTENPAGFNRDEREDWHIAVLYASEQRGYQTLGVGNDWIQYLFWEKNQQVPAGEWADSGVMITAIHGAGVYGVTDSSAFVPDEPLRIDGVETVFIREHSPGIMVCRDHIASAVGKPVYWMRS